MSCNYLAKGVSGIVSLDIPADTAILVVELPSGAELNEYKGHIVAERKHVVVW